jgi:hypothetical protein
MLFVDAEQSIWELHFPTVMFPHSQENLPATVCAQLGSWKTQIESTKEKSVKQKNK